jgi:hypothetical protein
MRAMIGGTAGCMSLGAEVALLLMKRHWMSAAERLRGVGSIGVTIGLRG